MNEPVMSYTAPEQGQRMRAEAPHSILSVSHALPVQEELCCHTVQTPRRALTERYISTVFRRIHGAKITQFMPILLSLGAAKANKAAVGMRRASSGPLFIESYLEAPIEDALTDLGVDVRTRHEIVEIGNLASTRSGYSQILFILLTSLMKLAGIKTVTFCGTKEVVGLMQKLGMQLHQLCDAHEERVVTADTDWGSYYAHQPKVCVVDVDQAYQALERCDLAHELIESYWPQLANIAKAM